MPDSLDLLFRSKRPGGDSLDRLFRQRPSKLERFGKEALGRAAKIGDFAENWLLGGMFPVVSLAGKAREALGIESPLQPAIRQAEALPPAETFGEKAAGFVGAALPDVALGIATGGVHALGAKAAAGAGASRFLAELAGQGAQSAALAPIEFGTRPPSQAALTTVAAPVAGTLLSRGLARAFGKPGLSQFEDVTAKQFIDPEGAFGPIRAGQRQGAAQAAEGIVAMREQFPLESVYADPITGPSFNPWTKPFMDPEGMFDEVRGMIRPAEASTALPPPTIGRALPPPPPVKPRTYYVTPEGAVHTNAMPGAAKVRATSRVEARQKWEAINSIGEIGVGERIDPQSFAFERIAIGAADPSNTIKDLIDVGVDEQQAIRAIQDPEVARLLAGVLETEGRRDLAARVKNVSGAGILRGLDLQKKIEQARLRSAAAAGKAIPTSAIANAGDPQMAEAAQQAFQAMQESAAQALSRAGIVGDEAAAALRTVAESGMNLPPAANKEIADALDSLPNEAVPRFLNQLKGKGTCPL